MKQLFFMIVITGAATFGSVFHPIWAVLLYYFFAILRPQYLWEWALPHGIRWSLLAAVILFFSLLANANRMVGRFKANVITVLLVVFALLVGASMVFAMDPNVSGQWAAIYAKVLLVTLMAAIVIDRMSYLRWLVLVAMLSIGYIAYTVNYLYLVNGRLDIYHVGYGGLDNNGAALLLAMGLPLTYCFIVSRAKGHGLWLRGLSVLLAAFLIHAVMMSYSRGAMLAAIVGVGWLMWRHRFRYQSVLALVLLAVMISVMAGPQIRDRFASTREYQRDSSAQRRVASWEAAWAMAWDRPILGYGIRNSSQYIKQFSDNRVAPTVHNQYLQVAADSGIPAVLTYVALVLFSLWRLRRSELRCRDAARQRAESHDATSDRLWDASSLMLGLQGSLLTFMVGGMFLSLELLELPWLIIAIAAAAPAVVDRLLDQDTHRIDEEEDVADDQEQHQASSRPARWRKRAA